MVSGNEEPLFTPFYLGITRGYLLKSLLVSSFRVSNLIDLGWGLEFAFLTDRWQVTVLLVWGPHLENH